MTHEDAEAILLSLASTGLTLTGEIRKLAGDTEHLVVFSDGTWLWSKKDWRRYQKGTLEALSFDEISA